MCFFLKTMSLFCVVTALTLPLPGEPLSSWHDTPVKRSIMTFIDSVTRPDSADFVPASERIAVFDNDGCLWSEQPVYFQAIFIFDRIKELAPQHPEWIHTEPFAYDRHSHVGRLDKALDEAPTRGWHVISMKNDWKTVFPVIK